MDVFCLKCLREIFQSIWPATPEQERRGTKTSHSRNIRSDYPKKRRSKSNFSFNQSQIHRFDKERSWLDGPVSSRDGVGEGGPLLSHRSVILIKGGSSPRYVELNVIQTILCPHKQIRVNMHACVHGRRAGAVWRFRFSFRNSFDAKSDGALCRASLIDVFI